MSWTALRDAWRLSVGTLTAVPVHPPQHVDRRVAGASMLLAPLAVLPLAGIVALVVWTGSRADVSPLATAVVAVTTLALGSRAFHLDGLADTADGLTASYDRERSLAVMRTGAAGPAGVVAVVLVLGAQTAGLTSLAVADHGWLTAGVLVCVSRGVLAGLCSRGVPGARPDGLGATFVGSVARPATAGVAVVAGAACWTVASVSGLIGLVAAVLVVAALTTRAVRRLGGVTGDVYGAGVEITLATLLVSVS
ncbi:MAG: adenosylcobinamide-GDP ribazoletransferase [Nocardioides sp.]|uniref:adenosylcobinamide-GDP ribazoletransferase n=1 Tax=Nocardioides sp. TaxID=35761 RepID=UPI00238894BE|nr:adenosylcobinamide-GDP ribazoletransferase [Nocardioides sp.]MDE0777999.1 adenosylcobinamide-GDP ribazoletransferase [Nocardioides sp.]